MSTEHEQALVRDKELWLQLRSEFFPGDSEIIRARQSRDNMLLQTIATNVDISEPVPVSSHRKIIGSIIVFTKRSMMKIARPWIKICLGRQQVINEQVMELAATVQELKLKIKYLEERYQAQVRERR